MDQYSRFGPLGTPGTPLRAQMVQTRLQQIADMDQSGTRVTDVVAELDYLREQLIRTQTGAVRRPLPPVIMG
ncbi:MAG: hypothetical protein LC799_12875 [Actinobacteria bacterium]|nr:hypothetical protein [Actinomycetota bacterium]